MPRIPLSAAAEKIIGELSSIVRKYSLSFLDPTIAKLENRTKEIELKGSFQREKMTINHSFQMKALERQLTQKFEKDDPISLSDDELEKLKNLLSIVFGAVDHLDDEIDEKPLGMGWKARFREDAAYIYDENLQSVYSRVLGNEISNPGTYSLRTLTIVRDLDPPFADCVTKINAFVWKVEDRLAVIRNLPLPELCRMMDVSIRDFHSAHYRGIIDADVDNFVIQKENDVMTYFHRNFVVKRRIRVPVFFLTDSGEELFLLSGAVKNDQYYEMCTDFMLSDILAF